MKTLKENNSLFDKAPVLVKEWHPTANGNLTPRNLEVVHPEKVWWICSEGHEWQATIKSRMDQNGCPVCEKEGMEKETDDSLNISFFNKNRRKHKRFEANATVVVELPDSGHWVYSEMKNVSHRGLLIETDSVIRPGSAVRVRFDKDLIASRFGKSHLTSNNNGYNTYHSTVKWYRRLDNDQPNSSFFIGLELKKPRPGANHIHPR